MKMSLLSEGAVMSPDPASEIHATKRDFRHILGGEYLVTGFFWVFSTVGSMVLSDKKGDDASTFFLTMSVLMISNCIWEMLTGWYADKFRRHVSMYAGFLACLFGFCLMGVAPLFSEPMTASPTTSSEILRNYRLLVWTAGVSIWSLGPALLSGAVEAWLVDRCNFFSQNPPEDFGDTFKKSAAYGIIAKSVGAAVCFFIFYFYLKDFKDFTGNNSDEHRGLKELVFGLSAGIAAGLSAWLFYRSRGLLEEYWSHPKYQTNESVFSFLWEGMRDLRRAPYFWFTFSFVGATSLNYVVSSSIWPYLVNNGVAAEVKKYAVYLILAEFIGSLLSGQFSKLIDRAIWPGLRIPVASLIFLAPLPLLFLFHGWGAILGVLIAAAFSFRIIHASVFGLLNTLGQQAIESDERRAVLISISSAISSFLMSVSFLLFYLFPPADAARGVVGIELFWRCVPPLFILMLVLGGYMAARPRTEAN
jgi:MFS family permease